MIDFALAAVLYIAPAEQPTAVRIQNISAARAARDIPNEWEDFQECVAARESSGRYNAQNPVSSAQGKYQFLDNKWRHGGAWNVWKRLIRYGYDKDTAKRVRERLMDTPIKKWRPVYQDILFAEALLSGQGFGWKHWYHPGSKCNQMVA